MEKTIPDPHPDEVETAMMAATFRAERAGLNPKDPKVAEFIASTAAVQANYMAQTRWLSNIVNDRSKINE